MSNDSVDLRKVSEEALREAALRYLERQNASVHQLREFFQRRISKYAGEEFSEQCLQIAEAIVQRFLESRLLDDQRLANALAENLRRRGASMPLIHQKLMQRGIDAPVIEQACDLFLENEELSDLASAQTFVRKRRLLERHDLSDPKAKQKALAALARQGFSFDVACQALGL